MKNDRPDHDQLIVHQKASEQDEGQSDDRVLVNQLATLGQDISDHDDDALDSSRYLATLKYNCNQKSGE